MSTNTQEVYAGLEPPEVWRHFAALNEIPRPSGEEAAARDYVKSVAEAAGVAYAEDNYGNVVVSVPATTGREAVPMAAIQSHLDMVCQKLPSVEHDFSRDPIRPQRDGDIIRATGTTLGADNGMGAAMGLALLTTPGLEHGPLELLFTVEEETGLFGAAALDPALLHSKYLINLDSEDPDELTVGCAGGAGVTLHLPVQREPLDDNWLAVEVAITGLKGGHSGVQIHEPLANAVKLLSHVLTAVAAAGAQFRLVGISGGSAHNAIPRDAKATVVVAYESFEAFGDAAMTAGAKIDEQWQEHEPKLRLDVRNAPQEDVPTGANLAMTEASTQAVIQLLAALPHGVITMSEVFEGKVETSSNLAIVTTHEEEVEVHVSSRSFIMAELERQQNHVLQIGGQAGAGCEVKEAYPGWEPNAHSHLLELAKTAYVQTYGKQPQVEVVHAGLECGIIVAKKPGLDSISFGPLIHFAHSPDECIYASTVDASWKLLTTLLKNIA